MMSPTRDELGAMGARRGACPVRGVAAPTDTPNGEVEAEMRLYLDKLREIVPHIPKNRKVTRLELIQHVIDYICDLQHALEDHPGLKDEPTARFLTPPTSPHHYHNPGSSSPTHNHTLNHHHISAISALGARQPLGVLSATNTLQTSMRRDVTKTTTSRLNGTISHTLPGGGT